MISKPKVVVAMSGGVDSSVAAALLLEQGYDVTGIMLRLWSEPGEAENNRCCTPDSVALARRVAAKLSIPFYTLDAQQLFYNNVVKQLIEGYERMITPNPCLVCNRLIRWGFLYERARSMGAEFMATGHYARIHQSKDGQYQLLRGIDPLKDQSYVLYTLSQEQLQHTLFPLGTFQKSQIRVYAKEHGLPVADRPDSQDLCFLGDGNYQGFLTRYDPNLVKQGPILNQNGTKLGEHTGLAFYTIGQRKGLGIAAPQPYYVLEKDPARNALIIGFADELGKRELITHPLHWIGSKTPEMPFRAVVKIRYKAHDVEALISPLEDGNAHIQFDQPLRDITPGQAAVIYQGDVCLGGGIIR